MKKFLNFFIMTMIFFLVLTSQGFVPLCFSENRKDVYDFQIKQYPTLSQDVYLKDEVKNTTIMERYHNNLKKYEETKKMNEKFVRLYNNEMTNNRKLKKLISQQMEEELALRDNFKKMQDEFENYRKTFEETEMTKAAKKISEYKKIKEETSKLIEALNQEYLTYIESLKRLNEQQENFYNSQMDLYQRMDSSFSNQNLKHEKFKEEINEKLKK